MLKAFGIVLAASTLLMSVPAQAEFRWLPRFWFQDDEPERQSYYDQTDDEDDVIIVQPSRRQFSIYEEDLGDDYYDPKFQKPVRKPVVGKPKAVSNPNSTKKVATGVAKSVTSKPVSAAKSGIGCDKGAAVVADYGFSAVKSKTCGSKILVYSAHRSGKPFEVSVSAASGEITEVRKIQ
jgi:hypothetical protein